MLCRIIQPLRGVAARFIDSRVRGKFPSNAGNQVNIQNMKRPLIYVLVVVVAVMTGALITGANTKRSINTGILIDASADEVWNVLVDFEKYPTWSPFIKSVSGSPVKGGSLNVSIQLDRQEAMTFSPSVIVSKPGHELRWISRVGVPFVFDGEMFFKIDEVAPGKVHFKLGEHFTGFLLHFKWEDMKASTRAGFEATNEALKARVEALKK